MVEHEHDGHDAPTTTDQAAADRPGPALSPCPPGIMSAGALLLGVVAFGATRPARQQRPRRRSGRAAAPTSAPHLTVQGSGQGSGTPDVLTAVFGFSTTAGSSSAALSQNNAKVATALQALSTNGVASRDTQTTGLNLSAQYAYPHGVPTLTGYQATETVSATLRHPRQRALPSMPL